VQQPKGEPAEYGYECHRGERGRQGEERYTEGADQLARGQRVIADAGSKSRRLQSQQRRDPLRQAGSSTAGDDGSCPLHEGGKVGHYCRSNDGASGERSRCGEGIEQVIHAGNVVCEHLKQCSTREHQQRGGGSEPGKTAAEMQVTAVGGDPRNQQRHENPKTDGGSESYAQGNRERCFPTTHFGHESHDATLGRQVTDVEPQARVARHQPCNRRTMATRCELSSSGRPRPSSLHGAAA